MAARKTWVGEFAAASAGVLSTAALSAPFGIFAQLAYADQHSLSTPGLASAPSVRASNQLGSQRVRHSQQGVHYGAHA